MSSTLTYVQFHALYVLPVVAALTATVHHRRDDVDWRVSGVGLAVVTALAVLYTLPWDRLLIDVGVWRYGADTVAGRLWGVPYEEIAFFVLQPALTTLWTVHVVGPVLEGVTQTWRDRAAGAVAGLAVGLLGLALLTTRSTTYLGAILAWAGPVLGLQWAVGWRYLWRARARVAVAVLVPSAYLWVVDRLAIEAGVWIISETYTTGLAVAGLPVEEMTFFVVTNLFVVQGVVLFRWVVHRWR
ncbi:lycopene cyclase domain-containing protein [Halosimplex salinum]|uniref:lycopene cyclase domain-containing protein n=1 Tax=Halosimplex salinum TaxID=1710538 RepID=UPI000F4785B3|nr:lycopene cyclase domain-containing protein [Halosimplex salinum]